MKRFFLKVENKFRFSGWKVWEEYIMFRVVLFDPFPGYFLYLIGIGYTYKIYNIRHIVRPPFDLFMLPVRIQELYFQPTVGRSLRLLLKAILVSAPTLISNSSGGSVHFKGIFVINVVIFGHKITKKVLIR